MIDWKTEAGNISGTMIALRRDFHRFPELGNTEVRTSDRICEYLRSLSVTVVRPFGTAVMGILHGEATDERNPPRTVALRADMDALPLTEDTGLAFASETAGVMHACGHDFHVAALLGAATLLASHRAELKGTVRFLFEPDEEGMGGAERMIRAGCLDPDVSAAFGLHVSPELPAGQIGIRYGSFYAASNPFRVTVYGKSAHGAEPEKGIDALAAAAAAVMAVRAIPGLLSDAPSVVSVCSFGAGCAENIIADRAELAGIMRTFGESARDKLKQVFRETVLRAVEPFGATVDISIRDSYPGVYNSEPETELAHRAACETFGEEQVTILERPTMTTEDFGYFILRCGGCFAHLGVGPTAPLHHPAFSPDERALPVGAAYLAAVAAKALCATDSFATRL